LNAAVSFLNTANRVKWVLVDGCHKLPQQATGAIPSLNMDCKYFETDDCKKLVATLIVAPGVYEPKAQYFKAALSVYCVPRRGKFPQFE
jgi:hypothetical protein